MPADRANLWLLLTSNDSTTREQGRELAVAALPIDQALQLMDRAAREHHLGDLDQRLGSEPKLTTAVASLMRHRATLLGLDQPPAPPEPSEADLTPPSDPIEHRLELIRAARRARMRAEAQGSWVAASSLLRQEADLLGGMNLGEDETGSEEELLGALVGAVREMPAALQARALALLAEACPAEDGS